MLSLSAEVLQWKEYPLHSQFSIPLSPPRSRRSKEYGSEYVYIPVSLANSSSQFSKFALILPSTNLLLLDNSNSASNTVSFLVFLGPSDQAHKEPSPPIPQATGGKAVYPPGKPKEKLQPFHLFPESLHRKMNP